MVAFLFAMLHDFSCDPVKAYAVTELITTKTVREILHLDCRNAGENENSFILLVIYISNAIASKTIVSSSPTRSTSAPIFRV